MKHNYIGFARMGNIFGPATGDGEFTPRLPAGHYKVDYDDYKDELALTAFKPHMDEILNLGCKEFNYVLNMAESFLSPQTEVAYKEQGFLLKRAFLFYGPPGTGKSVLSCKISDLAAARKDGIAIYPSSYEALERFLEVVGDTDKGRFTTVVLEEFDSLVQGRDEESWTTLLDGQFQTSNRLILATTNNVESIPKRLLRPGRFSSIIEIPALNSDARNNFLLAKKVTDDKLRKTIIKATDGFTIDDLKEVVQGALILNDSVTNVISAIRAAKELGKE